ncbi:MAG: PilZ domain-containing protein [Polyangiaceae bacterium]|nr:PilZ domain-containing protein [Polyangiaceae bacterium]
MRPVIELPATAALVPADAAGELHVVDVSLGGLGVWVRGRPPFEVGARLRLTLALGPAVPLEVTAEVRYVRAPDGAYAGLELDSLDERARDALGGYVAELVARGVPT